MFDGFVYVDIFLRKLPLPSESHGSIDSRFRYFLQFFDGKWFQKAGRETKVPVEPGG